MYGDAFARLERFAAAAPSPLREARDAPRPPLGGAAAWRAAWRRARSRSSCRPGGASIAGSAATAWSPPTRSRACARRAPQPLPKALSVDHAVALVAHRDERGDPRLAARDACIAELLYGCGLRVGELVGLDVVASGAAAGWIDAGDGSAHVLGKGRKRRAVPVGAPALAALADWLALRGDIARADEAALFVSSRGTRLTASQVRSRLKARAIAAGVADARPSAHAAPLVRLARAAVERRPARGAGAARPRQHHDDAGLHQARLRPPLEGVRRGASARASERRGSRRRAITR